MNPLQTTFHTCSNHFFSTMRSIKTNKIETVAKRIFPWIALTTLLGLMTLHSKISVGNPSNPKIYLLTSSILALSFYLITLDSHTGTKVQTPAHKTTSNSQGNDTPEKKLLIFETKLTLIEQLANLHSNNNSNLDQILAIINTMELLPDNRDTLHHKLFNCKLSIALPAFEAYFERLELTNKPEEVNKEKNELTKLCRPTNFACAGLQMKIDNFQSGGIFDSDPNLFLPSLLLIHFFFEKNCYFETAIRAKDRTPEMIEPRNQISDEEINTLLTSSRYNMDNLKTCIKAAYDSEINQNHRYKSLWISKKQLFNDWIDEITKRRSVKSARNIQGNCMKK